MKNYENYFNKNGFIYGVSSKFEFNEWHHAVTKFTDLKKAEKWLETEQYDFRERELCSKTQAIKYAGKKAIDNAYEV